LRSLVTEANKELDVKVKVRAERSKLLLYEEGVFLKQHKDAEKVPNMFGTMAVCLPSEHEGGEVHIYHAGQKKTYETAAAFAHDLTTMAWYSDVTHEDTPIAIALF
jgi:Rps23 Pro-64 3,4-dihydroxylase Tpa1-like proline 4-hydroxylase